MKRPGRLIAAGMLMGIGLGGFIDGILFHQILQFHNMLSNWVPRTTLVNEEINMFWDGLFQAFCWMSIALGLSLLWRCIARDRSRISVGSISVPSGLVGGCLMWLKA